MLDAEDASLDGDGDGMGPVVDPELGIDVQQVALDGRLADVELAGDVPVAASGGHQLEDVDLPAGEGGGVGTPDLVQDS